MAVTLTLTDIDPGTTQLYAFGTVQLSGNYSSGGDSIDWTQLAKQIAVRGADPRIQHDRPRVWANPSQLHGSRWDAQPIPNAAGGRGQQLENARVLDWIRRRGIHRRRCVPGFGND